MLFLVGAFIIFSVLTRNVILCYNRRDGGLSAVSWDYFIMKNAASRKGLSQYGTPDAIRTHDLQSRSLTLYPAELQAHINIT